MITFEKNLIFSLYLRRTRVDHPAVAAVGRFELYNGHLPHTGICVLNARCVTFLFRENTKSFRLLPTIFKKCKSMKQKNHLSDTIV